MTSPDVANGLFAAIRHGDVAALERLIAEDRQRASSPLGGRYGQRTPLHVVTDWPGYYPNGPRLAAMLLAAGADPNARTGNEPGVETPLHWAASTDDVDVAAVLIDAGADIEARGGSIGTPLDNAIGYACWRVARLLVTRGARVEKLWHAAALGMVDGVEQLLTGLPATVGDEISQAFWHACAGGHRRAAEYLLAHGAALDWVPDYAEGSPLDAAHSRGTARDALIAWLRERGARSASAPE